MHALPFFQKDKISREWPGLMTIRSDVPEKMVYICYGVVKNQTPYHAQTVQLAELGRAA